MAWTKTKTATVIAAALLAAGTATIAVKFYLLPRVAETHLRTVLRTPQYGTNGLLDPARIDLALREFGNHREVAFAILKGASEETNRHLVGGFFRDTNSEIRWSAFCGMGVLGKSVPEIQPYLWSVALSPSRRDDHDDSGAFFALRHIGFQPEDMTNLIKLVSDPTLNKSKLTILVADVISEMIESNSLAVDPYLPELKSLLDDSNPDIQFHAALALVKSEGATNPQIFAPLHAFFQRPKNGLNEYDKWLAVLVLGGAGPTAKPLIPDLLQFSKSTSQIGMQQTAYEAIARIEPDLASQIPEVAAFQKQPWDDGAWRPLQSIR